MKHEEGFKGIPWSKEILVQNCNALIRSFLQDSQSTSFKQHFSSAISKQHPKKQVMINFVLLYFFSLQKYAKECYEVEILQKLFDEKLEKQLYKQWSKIKTIVLKLKKVDIRESEKIVLSECFLEKHEALVVAERSGYESQEEISEWLDSAKEQLVSLRKELKENSNKKAQYEFKSKVFKLTQTAASAVAWKIMNWYLGSYERELEKRKREMLMRYAEQKNDEDSDIMEVDSNGNCMSDRFSAQSSCDHLVIKKNRIQDLEDQKNALTLET